MRQENIAKILAHTDEFTKSQLESMSLSVLAAVFNRIFSRWQPEVG